MYKAADPNEIITLFGHYQRHFNPKDWKSTLVRNRLALLEKHEIGRMKIESQLKDMISKGDYSKLKNEFVPGHPEAYKAAMEAPEFKAENFLTIEQLELNKFHKGKMILLVSLTHPVRWNSVHSVVEDEKGEVTRISFFNCFQDAKTIEEYHTFFPKGTMICIFNPWYTKMPDGGLSIRVDNPQNVQKCPTIEKFRSIGWKGSAEHCVEFPVIPGKDLPKTPHQWKLTGNEWFKKGKWFEAADDYTEGLKAIGKEYAKYQDVAMQLLANRAECALKVEMWEPAIKDLEFVLKADPGHIKGNYRMIRARIGMKEWEKAEQLMTHLESLVEPKKAENKPEQEQSNTEAQKDGKEAETAESEERAKLRKEKELEIEKYRKPIAELREELKRKKEAADKEKEENERKEREEEEAKAAESAKPADADIEKQLEAAAEELANTEIREEKKAE